MMRIQSIIKIACFRDMASICFLTGMVNTPAFILQLLFELCIAIRSIVYCNSVDWNLPGSSVHGISQAGILEWIAIFFLKGSTWPRDGAHISCTERGFFTIWAAREVLYGPLRNSTLGQEAKSHKFMITCQVQDFLLTKLHDSILLDIFLSPILVYHSKTKPCKMTHI